MLELYEAAAFGTYGKRTHMILAVELKMMILKKSQESTRMSTRGIVRKIVKKIRCMR